MRIKVRKRSWALLACSVLALALALCACQSQSAVDAAEAGASEESGAAHEDVATHDAVGIPAPGEDDHREFPVVYDPEHGRYRAGVVVAHFKPGVSEERAREVAAEAGMGIVSYMGDERHPELGPMLTASILDGSSEDEAISVLEEFEEVKSAARSGVMRMFEGAGLSVDGPAGPEVPEEPDASDVDLGEYHLSASRFDEAFESAKCAGTVTVAVVDTGAPAASLADLAPNVDYGRAANAMHDPVDQEGVYDTAGHGTAVAGVVSAVAGNGEGLTGASWNARILPVKVSDGEDADVDAVLRALDYLASLDDPPEVVNMSFGNYVEDEEVVAKLQSRIDGLVSAGCTCVAATGNDAFPYNLLEGDPSYPNRSHCPANLSGVVAVGALTVPSDYYPTGTPANGHDSYDPRIAPFSNTASDTDICAHGVSIKALRALPIPVGGLSYTVVEELGTSFAAPQVAAAAALVAKAHPGWSPSRVEEALEKTAFKPSDFSDADGDGRDDDGRYGYGALDAAAAVGWTEPSGGGSSPFTGPGDDFSLSELQITAQQRFQATRPEGIPGALARAMRANPDVFAWLYVPGTGVSLPVARREGDPSYYLSHDSLGNESAIGCAFAAPESSEDMADAVTALYGHSFSAGNLALTSLHAFEDYGFFATHDRAYVYLPGRRLSYRVVGAYLFTDKAIGALDQSDPGALAEYFASLSDTDPSTYVGFKRGPALDPSSDRVLQLSTCTVPAVERLRFVVTCVYEGKKEV